MKAQRLTAAFLQACALDVAVRKPGNVSAASPGHGMQAADFLRSAQAAAPAIALAGARVGERIEAAVQATWAAVGCNTNLGILLLCAPIAVAAERLPDAAGAPAWAEALGQVLSALDLADAQAAFRAIAQARPGGLGEAPEHDVSQPAQVTLRAAMGLAAGRDRIARQYHEAYGELWRIGLPALGEGALQVAGGQADPEHAPDDALVLAVQRVYLAWLASGADSHLVRKHGEAVAHSVTQEAQRWLVRARDADASLDQGASAGDWRAWDAGLKARGWNPGTSADLTVATLFLAALVQPPQAPSADLARIV